MRGGKSYVWERRLGVLAIAAAMVWSGYLVSSRRPVSAVDRSANHPEVKSAVSLQEAFVEVAKQAEPSVVNIQVEKKPEVRNGAGPRGPRGNYGNPFEGSPFEDFFKDFGGPRFRGQAYGAQGSGFIFDKEGYVLTNYHVVEGAEKVKVVLLDKREFDGKVVGSDPRLDLAVVKIKGGNLDPAQLGNSDDLRVGEWAIAVGNPFGLDHTLTVGVISAKGRELDMVSGRSTAQDFIQTDAAINPGNSGGPLLNIYGDVIGINNSIYSTTGGNNGIGFAIPINNAKAVLKQLIEKGKVTRGWLGISIQELQPEMAKTFGLPNGTKGVLVGEVTQGSPAEKAGFKPGDVVMEFGKRKTESPRELQRVVAGTPVGDEVSVRLSRDGREQTIRVKIGEMPANLEGRESPESMTPEAEPSGQTWRGLSLRQLTPEIAERLGIDQKSGVIVSAVEPGSSAEAAGLAPGDVIKRVGGKEVHNLGDLRVATKGIGKADPVRLWVSHGGHSRFVLLKPEE